MLEGASEATPAHFPRRSSSASPGTQHLHPCDLSYVPSSDLSSECLTASSTSPSLPRLSCLHMEAEQLSSP